MIDEQDQRPPPTAVLLLRPLSQHEGLRRWADGLLPHAYVEPNNPIFSYELRDWNQGRSRRDLALATGLGFLRDAVFALVLWGLAFAMMGAGNPEDQYDRLWLLLGLAAGLAVITAYVLDAFCLFISAARQRQHEISGAQRDLMRLSPVEGIEVVRARYAASQIRVWNIMRTGAGLRVIVLVFLLMNLLVAPGLIDGLDAGRYFTLRFERVFEFGPAAATGAILSFSLAMLALVLLIEPLWRMRALVAMGLAAGISERSQMGMIIYGSGALVGIWLLQATMILAGGIMLFIASTTSGCLNLMFPVMVLVLVGSLRMLYLGMTLAGLQAAFYVLQSIED